MPQTFTIWSKKQIDYLKKNYHNTTNIELSKIIGVTESAIIGKAFKLGLRKDREFMLMWARKTAFKKGSVPVNKGKKMPKDVYERCKGTMFKKGSVPPNHRPVGSERISKDGYIELKVGEGLRMWKLKHRVVYEQHFGEIPKGYNVEFKDRNRRNFDPSNLVLRTRKENMKLNTYHNYPKEIANAIQLLGAMNRQINKAKKRVA